MKWGVALATASRALTVLRDEGWVETVPRVGSLVAAVPPLLPAIYRPTPRRG